MKVEVHVIPPVNTPAGASRAPDTTGPTAVEKPNTPPVAKPEPKTEPKAELQPPKAVEVPAENRVTPKPDTTAVEPVKPEALKPDTTVKPDAPVKPAELPTPPGKVPEPPKVPDKPPVPPVTPDNAPKKDNPFDTSNDVQTYRMWTDASGTYQIEARFVSCQDGAGPSPEGQWPLRSHWLRSLVPGGPGSCAQPEPRPLGHAALA